MARDAYLWQPFFVAVLSGKKWAYMTQTSFGPTQSSLSVIWNETFYSHGQLCCFSNLHISTQGDAPTWGAASRRNFFLFLKSNLVYIKGQSLCTDWRKVFTLSILALKRLHGLFILDSLCEKQPCFYYTGGTGMCSKDCVPLLRRINDAFIAWYDDDTTSMRLQVTRPDNPVYCTIKTKLFSHIYGKHCCYWCKGKKDLLCTIPIHVGSISCFTSCA